MHRTLPALLACTAVALLSAARPASTHHAFAAEFDSERPIEIRGVVKKMEWINPHTWITLDVTNEDGTVDTWEIEGGAPNALFRRGFTRDSLPVGTEIVVRGFQARAGGNRANGRDLTLPNGERLFFSPSAPGDGAN